MSDIQESAEFALVGRSELDDLRRLLATMLVADSGSIDGIDPVAALRQVGALIRCAENVIRSADAGLA